MDAVEPGALTGRRVIDANGKVLGRVDLVFDEPVDGEARWMGIRTQAIRRQRVLVPLTGAERRALSVQVPWTRARLRNAPAYSESDLGGMLGLGEYRLTLPTRKLEEARAYWGIGDGW